MRDAEHAAAFAFHREPEAIDSGLQFGGDRLLLLPSGARGWSCVLKNDLVNIRLGRGGVTGVACVIRLSAAYLWALEGLDQAWDDLEEFVEWVWPEAVPSEAVQVSEVHLCRDVAGLDVGEWWPSLRSGFVKRADNVGTEEKHGAFQTVHIGSRHSPVDATLYDKLAELKVSHKLWFKDIWSDHGWDGEAPVWRLEFRMRRDFLRISQVNSFDELCAAIPRLWAYVSTEWLRHTEADPRDSNRWRHPVSVWWTSYAHSWDGRDHSPITVDRKRVANAEKLVEQGAGCLLSAVALYTGDAGSEGEALPEDAAALVIDRFNDLLRRLGGTYESLLDRRRRRYQASG